MKGVARALPAVLVLLGSIVVAAWPMGYAASSQSLLGAWLDPAPASAPLVLARFGGPTATLAALRLVLATCQLALTAAVGWQFGNRGAAALAPLVLLLWPTSRAALVDAGAESLVSTGILAVLLGTPWLATRPALGALLVGCGLASMTVATPLGLWLAIPLLVWAAMAPAREPRPDEPSLRARPIWFAWGAAGLVWFSAVRVVLSGDAAPAAWNAMIAALRAPIAGLQHGADALPVFGTLFAVLATLPLPLLAGLAMRRDGPVPAIGAPLLALVVFAVAGRPAPGMLDVSVAIAAPLAAVALAGLGRRLDLGRDALLAAALLLALVGESVHQDGRGTTLLGRALLHDVDRASPARLSADDLAVLAAHTGPTSIHPGRRGGDALVATLVRLELLPKTVKAWHPFGTGRVLLRAGPLGAEASTWWAWSEESAGRGRASLRTLRGPAAVQQP